MDHTNSCFPDMKTMFCDLDSNVSYQLKTNMDIISKDHKTLNSSVYTMFFSDL